MQSSKMTTKYIWQIYNKDIESSQEKNNGEENIQSYSEDVSSEENAPSTEDISQHHSVKLQALLIWLKLQTIESHIAKVKRNQAVEDVLRYNTDLISGNIPERVLFEDNDNQRYANTFSAIDTEIISLKKNLKILRNHRCVTSNEIANINKIRSKGSGNFLKLRKDPNIKTVRKKFLRFETKKKAKKSGLDGKYWQLERCQHRRFYK